MTMTPMTLSQVLKNRASKMAGAIAYRTLAADGSEKCELSYSKLDQQVDRLTGYLQPRVNRGDRVILMFNSIEHFIYSFYACLRLGAIAVPLKTLKKRESLSRLFSVADSCEPSCVLTDTSLPDSVNQLFTSQMPFQAMTRIDVETLFSESVDLNEALSGYVAREQKPEDVAFIQFTSGSTGAPKGVVIDNANVMANSEMIRQSFGYGEKTVMVSWLPLFHDMGLIGGVLQPMYTGFSCILMDPTMFVMRPMTWLKVISHYQATTAGAPNFAYDLCVARFREKALVDVDLSSLTLLFNGAEPIKASTLDRFSTLYQPYGFKTEAFMPCYGMAEATLLVSCKPLATKYQTVNADVALLERDKQVQWKQDSESTVPIVSSGNVAAGMSIVIIDELDQQSVLSEGQVGRVAIRGDNVTRGYWGRPELNEELFLEVRNCSTPGRYFDTGDMGFVYQEQLYIIGRADDMMILNGRNVYPDNIEHAIEHVSELVVNNGVICFQSDSGVVALVEVVAKSMDEEEMNELGTAINNIASAEYDISFYNIHYVQKRQLPKTSSGKKMRKYCKRRYLADTEGWLSNMLVEQESEIA